MIAACGTLNGTKEEMLAFEVFSTAPDPTILAQRQQRGEDDLRWGVVDTKGIFFILFYHPPTSAVEEYQKTEKKKQTQCISEIRLTRRDVLAGMFVCVRSGVCAMRKKRKKYS